MSGKRATGDTTAIFATNSTKLSGGAWPQRVTVKWLLARKFQVTACHLPHCRARVSEGLRLYAGILAVYESELTRLDAELSRRRDKPTRAPAPRPRKVASLARAA